MLDLYLSHLTLDSKLYFSRIRAKSPPVHLGTHEPLLSVFLTAVTLLTVTAMSVDRYLAIYLHLRYEQLVTEKRARNVILCLWLISSVPLVIVFLYAMASYLVMTLLMAVCLVIISFAWIKIYQVVRHHQVQIQDQIAVATQSFNMARYMNSAISTFLVLLIVLFCY